MVATLLPHRHLRHLVREILDHSEAVVAEVERVVVLRPEANDRLDLEEAVLRHAEAPEVRRRREQPRRVEVVRAPAVGALGARVVLTVSCEAPAVASIRRPSVVLTL